MIFEDMNPKKVANIKSYLERKKALIVETNKTTRTTLKKILVNFGLKVQNIYIADNYSDACKIINDVKVQLVFVAHEVLDKKGIEILEVHMDIYPNRKDTMFTLISGPNSLASSCLILDTEADDYIAGPFTSKSISESIIKTVERKIKKSPFITAYHQIKAHIYLNELNEARELLETLNGNINNLDEIYYLQAQIFYKENDLEQALKLYEMSIEVNPTHYSSLMFLAREYYKLKMWKKAYTHKMKMLNHYPLNPEDLPELIKLSIANQQYEDLIKYADFFKNLAIQSPSIKTNVAASLVICSKYLFKNKEREKGVDTLKEAVAASSGKMSILENIIQTSIEYKEIRLALQIMKEFTPIHGANPIFKNLEVQIDYFNKDIQSALKKGLPLVESGIASQQIYEIVILCSIKAQRKTNSIIYLIDKAVTQYPSSSDFFHSMYKS